MPLPDGIGGPKIEVAVDRQELAGRAGAGGYEREEHQYVVFVPLDAPAPEGFTNSGAPLPVPPGGAQAARIEPGRVLVRSSDSWVRVETDLTFLHLGSNGRWYGLHQERPAGVVSSDAFPVAVLEIVTGPFGIDDEPGRPSRTEVDERVADVLR